MLTCLYAKHRLHLKTPQKDNLHSSTPKFLELPAPKLTSLRKYFTRLSNEINSSQINRVLSSLASSHINNSQNLKD